MKDGCVFCNYEGPSAILASGTIMAYGDSFSYFVIQPIDPVTEGHLLVIPHDHVADFRNHPRLLGAMMEAAARVASASTRGGGCNLIVSAGEEATQTVMHMHVHVVPRWDRGDGLALPWS